MFQIPYGAIGIGIAIILGIMAFRETYSTGARVAIAGFILAIILLPAVWHGQAGQVAQLVVGTLFGVVSYVFIKAHGANIR